MIGPNLIKCSQLEKLPINYSHIRFQYIRLFIISILFCLYLGSLILYRNVFVLQMDLRIPPFKLNIDQPSIMFLTREVRLSKPIVARFFWDTLYMARWRSFCRTLQSEVFLLPLRTLVSPSKELSNVPGTRWHRHSRPRTSWSSAGPPGRLITCTRDLKELPSNKRHRPIDLFDLF